MALDHFVSRVHLKQFGSPLPSCRLNAVKKSDLKQFQPWPKDVCRVEKWSSNPCFEPEGFIENVAKIAEPGYDHALETISRRSFDEHANIVFSAFAAFLYLASPTTMRSLSHLVPDFSRRLLLSRLGTVEGRGKNSSAKLNQDADQILQIESSNLRIRNQERVGQAILLSKTHQFLGLFLQADKEFLISNGTREFVSSDVPFVSLPCVDRRVKCFFMPLSPSIGVKFFLPETGGSEERDYRICIAAADRREVGEINVELVKSAEEFVFFRKRDDGLLRLIKRYRSYRIEASEVLDFVASATR